MKLIIILAVGLAFVCACPKCADAEVSKANFKRQAADCSNTKFPLNATYVKSVKSLGGGSVDFFRENGVTISHIFINIDEDKLKDPVFLAVKFDAVVSHQATYAYRLKNNGVAGKYVFKTIAAGSHVINIDLNEAGDVLELATLENSPSMKIKNFTGEVCAKANDGQ